MLTLSSHAMDQLITYENPIFDIPNSKPKPSATGNKSFPYNDLADDRRFEELLYNLISLKIQAETFPGFDKVSLMNGVREKGRDCALFRNGKSYGLIQCKKYKTNLSKQVFGEEITKFVLYSLLFPGLIADRDDFTYYIAVSSGFSCLDFIDDFNTLIATETDLGTWVNKKLKHPTLSPLKLINPEAEVRDILTKMKVVKMQPQDLDGYLSEPSCNHLQPLFFDVRVLVDAKSIEDLTAELCSLNRGGLKKEQLEEQLRRGSSSLSHEINQFEDIPDSHIARHETQELLRWLLNPASKDPEGKDLNVCLLAGNAGMGKTVILKDLYDELRVRNVPALGLKADKLYAASIAELQEKIGLPVPVFEFVELCKQKYQQVVLMIDQIDALSQAMFTSKGALDVYKSLIDYYTHDPKVRIVISVRIFDLHYDPSLRVYKNIKDVKVQLLNENEVLTLLEKIGFKVADISEKLLSLLRVPNHLNIFSRIAPNFSGSLGVTSIQELYHELWRQKVLTKPSIQNLDSPRIKKVLYKLANQMFKTQRLPVSEHHFEEFSKELFYLESERLLKRENKDIQFFHQTFYDFVYAKRFVEKQGNLLTYIKSQDQSILIRSAVKMILNYMRDYDHEKYAGLMDSLLQDSEIHFHIKQMLVSMLAFIDHPSDAEQELLVRNIPQSIHLFAHFFNQAQSEDWFKFLVLNGQLSFLQSIDTDDSEFIKLDDNTEHRKVELNYLRHTALVFVSHFAQKQLQEAWDFIATIQNQGFIKAILHNLNDWSLDRAYHLLDFCKDFMEDDPFSYLYILEKIAPFRPEYAWSKIKGPLQSQAKVDKSYEEDYEELQVLKELSKQIPEKMVETLSQIIFTNLQWENILDTPLVGDYSFTRVDLIDSEDLFGQEYLYRLLAVCLRRAARKDVKEFRAFLLQHRRSNHKAILRLIIFSLETNEAHFATEIYDLFIYLREIDHLKEGDDLSVEFRIVFENAFHHFHKNQQAEIINTLKNLVIKDEAFVMTNGGKPYRIQYWGRGKYAYLLKLPKEIIDGDKILKRQFKELARKHGAYRDKSSSGPVLAGIVQPPLPIKAYTKMSVEQWLKSFRKYSCDTNHFGDDHFKGGIYEHSNGFKDAASKGNPNQIFSIIAHALVDTKINIIYAIKGLLGLAEANADQASLISLFKQLLVHPEGKKEVRSLLHIVKYLVGNEKDEPELVDFLIRQSENYEDLRATREVMGGETRIGGLITRGINTIHGSAAQALLYINDPAMEDRVFAALERVLRTGPEETRAALYFRFAHLNHLNLDRAFALFQPSLVKETNIYIVASSIWSLQYMGSHDFQKLKPIYEKLVVAKILGSDDVHLLFSILYFSYLFNRAGAEQLLYKLLNHNTKCRAWALTEFCKNFYHNEDSEKKNLPLMLHVITKFANDTDNPLQVRALYIDHIKLPDIYDFLKAYINSKSFTISGSLLKYFTQQCSSYTVQCIELFNLAIAKVDKKDSTRTQGGTNEDFTKFVIAALTTLKGNDTISRGHRNALMESFQVILKDLRFRANAEKLLEELL